MPPITRSRTNHLQNHHHHHHHDLDLDLDRAMSVRWPENKMITEDDMDTTCTTSTSTIDSTTNSCISIAVLDDFTEKVQIISAGGNAAADKKKKKEEEETKETENRPIALRDISNGGRASQRNDDNNCRQEEDATTKKSVSGSNDGVRSDNIINRGVAEESSFSSSLSSSLSSSSSSRVSFDECNMELLEEIGGGAQSRVFRGRDKRDGCLYAVKVIDYGCNIKYADRELEIHQSLDFSGIVKLHGHYFRVSPSSSSSETLRVRSLCLVLELCSKSLLDVLQENESGRISEVEAAKYVVEIVDSLKYLHSKGVIHRDIKMANILLSKDKKVKIADLGVATRVRDRRDRKTIIGTRGYMAPEIDDNARESAAGTRYLRLVKELGASASLDIPSGVELYDSQYDENVDVYSLGAVIYVMLTGKDLNGEEDSSGFDFGFGFQGGEDAFDFDFAQDVLSMNAMDLILGLLDEDPMLRLSLDDVLKHPWLVNNV